MKIKLWTFEDMTGIRGCINSGTVKTCHDNQRKMCVKKESCLRWGGRLTTIKYCKPYLVTIERTKK